MPSSIVQENPAPGQTRIVCMEIPAGLRLGQAIANAMKSSMICEGDGPEESLVYSGLFHSGQDIFYSSDEDLQKALLAPQK